MFPYKVIRDLTQAEEYRENLDSEGEEYLGKVDKFTASITHGEAVNLNLFVKPSNVDRFWLAFSYILLACGFNLNISEDYTVISIYKTI